jgi:hypothetical protein
MSAPFSATMMVGALVLPEVMVGKHRSVDDAKVFQPVNLDSERRHGAGRVRSHAAGAHGMKHGAGAGANVGDHVRVALDMAPGTDFFIDDFRQAPVLRRAGV